MKIFVDTNVIIDYLVDRAPYADDAEAVMMVALVKAMWEPLLGCRHAMPFT